MVCFPWNIQYLPYMFLCTGINQVSLHNIMKVRLEMFLDISSFTTMCDTNL